MKKYDIDWGIVNKHLKCPICGDPAHISAETDGLGGQHTHHFKISREHAEALTRQHRSKPTEKELLDCIKMFPGFSDDGLVGAVADVYPYQKQEFERMRKELLNRG